MDTQTLRQRSKDAAAATPAAADDKKTIREKKIVRARRGLRSLAIAVALPLILAILSSFLSSPPAWAMHVAAATTAGLMGLAAWLVWAEGGMRSPAPVALFAAQLVLGLAWEPFADAGIVGVVLSLAKAAVLAGCARSFRRVNPFAGNLVTPCIVWAAFLALLSYRMM